MNQRRWRLAAILGAAATFSAVILAAVVLLLARRNLEARRAQLPAVLITNPVDGIRTRTGSRVGVSVTVLGGGPLRQVEMWANGEQVETWVPSLDGDPAPSEAFASYAGFSPIVRQGANMLIARAVTEGGEVAQSEPVIVFGEGEEEWSTEEVWLEAGLDLQEAANALGVDPASLLELNPGLTDGMPPNGALVLLPSPLPASAPPAPSTPTGAPQQQLPPLVDMSAALLAAILPAQPAAGSPGSLQAQTQGCHVTISWQDNTDGELSYEVWRTRVGGVSLRIASLAPVSGQGGVAHFGLDLPSGQFSLWVEAVGPFGHRPSNIAWLSVEPPCGSGEGPLRVDVLDVQVTGAHDRAYCYISLDGAPEARIPADRGAFVPVNGAPPGAGRAGTGVQIAVPRPEDDSIDLSGECWAWAGDTLTKLGTFQQSIHAGQWDGERVSILGEGSEVGISVGPGGGIGYTTDPTLPPPYNLRVADRGDPSELDELELAIWYWYRDLSWDWSGTAGPDIDFRILIDGAPYMTVFNDAQRTQTIKIPRICGDPVRLQVVAVSGQAQSAPSAALEVPLPGCRYVLDAWFEYVWFKETHDPAMFSTEPDDCQEFELYFELSVNDQVHSFGSADSFYPVRCGMYWFRHFAGPPPGWDHFRVVQPAGNPIDLRFRANFWDQDANPDDHVASMYRTFWFPEGYTGPGAPSEDQHCYVSEWQHTSDALSMVRFCYRVVSVTP